VDKIGTRKALKALARPIKEIADAIQRQDAKWLTTLPGVGAPTAEKIVATLKRKVTRYALAPAAKARPETNGEAAVEEPAPTTVVGGDVLEEAYEALVALGHSPMEARNRLDRALSSGKAFASAEEVLRVIYNK
jgi:Holliday junction DNA helicase RuvA